MNNPLGGGLDASKAAGLIVLAALATLAIMRRSFGGVNIRVGD